MADNRNYRFNRFDQGCTGCSGLKKKLREIDFAIYDTVLYLDVYPECQKALEYYRELIGERENLADAINSKCGPMTIRDGQNCSKWEWTKGPWPWEPDAN